MNIIHKHFVYHESCEETLVLRVVNKYIAINLCNNFLSPAHFRYTAFLETNPPTVVIRPMPKEPHSVAENYFSDLINEMYMAGVLTATEANSRKRTTVDVLLPSRSHIHVPGELGTFDIKVADAAFGPTWNRLFPFVVVEVGFSQPYDDPKKAGLLQDARHWLEQSEGAVKCVILVCIDEKKELIQRPTGDKYEGENHDEEMKDNLERGSEQYEMEGMPNGQGGEIGEYESEDSDTDNAISAQTADSPGSPVKAYEAHLKRFSTSPHLVAQHAGPFTAFIEVWRYDKRQKQMVQSGSRVILLPTPSLPAITLTRRDLGFCPTEENNEYHMSLGKLANLLKGPAREMLAFQRYIHKETQRSKQENVDGE